MCFLKSKLTHFSFLQFFVIVFIFLSYDTYSQTTIGASPYTVPSTGTYTIPAGVTSITVDCWGGGGGGGGVGSSANDSRGGGGGGGACSTITFAVTPGTVFNIDIGAGGSAGSNSGGNGGTGGTSRMYIGATIYASASGGAGGQGKNNGTAGTGGAGGSTGLGTVRSGGNGIAGDPAIGSYDFGGSGGGGAGTTANGSNGNSPVSNNAPVGGNGGATGGGKGGNGARSAGGAVAGGAGATFGGGGGGASRYNSGSATGGAGATGRVVITYISACTVSSASSLPTLCVNTLMTSITHTTSGVTGITSSSGLPTGVTAAYASNAITISGTPSVSGTFNYTITPTGCATVATGTITVNPSLPASVNISRSPAGAICAGTSVTFTAVPTNGGTTPSYQWKVNGANVGTNSPTFTSAALTNGQAVTCEMTSNATPCLTGSPVTSNTITMMVTPSVAASVSIAATPGTNVCIGTNVTFTATPTNGGTPSYQWKLDGSNVGTGPTYSNNALTNTSAVTCVMTSTATCATGSPVTSNSISGIVPAAPTAISGTASAVCQVPAGSGWVRFLDGSGKLVVSINPGSNNLGLVTADAYDHGSSVLTQACNTGTNPEWTTAVLGRSWRITPTNNLGASLELPFEDGEMSNLVTASSNTASNPRDNVISRGDLKMSRYSGASQNGSWSDNCADGGTSLIGSQLGNGTSPAGIAASQYVQFATPGFSEFWLHGNTTASPLPITLTNFGASCDEKGDVQLNWSTASEQNASHFVIERSRDLVTWNVVSTLPAGGNTTTEQLYALTDVDALGGVSYYRLVQVDFDGESEIYGPIAVTCESTEGNSMTVFPNPTKADFTVEITSTSSVTGATLQLTDLTGKVIASRQVDLVAGNNQLLFSDLDLQMGTYIIRIQSELEIRPVKLVVNR